MSRTRKLPGRQQPRNRTPSIGIVRTEIEAPPPPEGMLKASREQWAAFWKSPAAQIVEIGTDLPALERLFSLYDERRRAQREYQRARMVKGSKDQLVRNPLSRVIADCDAAIRVLEDRFGLTPKARLQLGIAPGGGPGSIDELNRRLNQGDDESDGDRDEDPRLAAI